MKVFIRVGISVYLAVICMIAFNLVFGTGGIIEYNKLNDYKMAIETNIWDLNGINHDLILDSDKLIQQPDDVKVQARELGWFEENEGIIVVNGYKKSNSGYAMGKLMSHDKRSHDNRHSSLIIALLAGFSFYIFSGFFKNLRFKK